MGKDLIEIPADKWWDSGKVVLNEAYRAGLMAKYDEYIERLKGLVFRAPEDPERQEIIYRTLIITELLKKGSLDAGEFSRKLVAEKGNLWDANSFHKAFLVVGDYATAGGKGTHGGTGFPGPEKKG